MDMDFTGVCRRWRQIIFASVRRLDLQFVCNPRTRVRELLDFLPSAWPIMVSNYCSSQTQQRSTPNYEDMSQVITAIEQRDRVWWIHLQDISSSLLEEIVKTMRETFPMLKHLRLWVDDEIAPSFPKNSLADRPQVSKYFG